MEVLPDDDIAGHDQNTLEDVKLDGDHPTSIVDFKRLMDLTHYSEKGSSQLALLVKSWENKQANAIRLLYEELDILSQQRQDQFNEVQAVSDEHIESWENKQSNTVKPLKEELDKLDIFDENIVKDNVALCKLRVDVDKAECESLEYWKQRALRQEKLSEERARREQLLVKKINKFEESLKDLETQASPVEELSRILKRADNHLHLVLQSAPVVIGHQDNELRYRFIYNHYPSLDEEVDIIGKKDDEIFSGLGVKEFQDFKREVLEKGIAAKREITFETPLFGMKTFLLYVEPVFSKSGEAIGINYMGMDVTDQVKKREKTKKIREAIAVQKARENELQKTIYITEQKMREKQVNVTDQVQKRDEKAELGERLQHYKRLKTELNKTIHNPRYNSL